MSDSTDSTASADLFDAIKSNQRDRVAAMLDADPSLAFAIDDDRYRPPVRQLFAAVSAGSASSAGCSSAAPTRTPSTLTA